MRSSLLFLPLSQKTGITKAKDGSLRNGIDKIPELGFTDRDEKNQHGRRTWFRLLNEQEYVFHGKDIGSGRKTVGRERTG